MDNYTGFEGPYSYRAARKAVISGHIRQGVYMLVAIDCSWIYVGSSADVSQRFGEHKYLLKSGRHPKQKMQEYFNSGSELMYFFQRCPTREEAYALEQHVLEVLSKHDGLLNAATDAKSPWIRGNNYVHPLTGIPRSDATKKKLSEIGKRPGRKLSMLNRRHSEESRKLMSDKAKSRFLRKKEKN